MKREVDRGRTGHVRSRHRRAAQDRRGCIARVPGTRDADAGREDVDARSVVGERSACIRRIRSRHRDGGWFLSRTGRARIGVGVARRDHHGDAISDRGSNRVVHRLTGAAAQAHAEHGWSRDVIGDRPVDARNHASGGTRAGAVEHADRHQRHALGDSIGRATNGAGDVRAMTVAVGGVTVVVDLVIARAYATGELRVGHKHAGVDDVGGYTTACARRGEVSVQRQRTLVDAIQAPGGAPLCAGGNGVGARTRRRGRGCR